VAVMVCGRHGLWPSWFVAVIVCGRHCLWPSWFVAVIVEPQFEDLLRIIMIMMKTGMIKLIMLVVVSDDT